MVDYYTPSEAAVGIFYLVPITIVFNQRKRVIFLFSLLSSFLLLINYFVFYENHVVDAIYKDNRVLAILAILSISFFAIKHRILRDKSKQQKELRIKALEDMLFITSHKVRQPVANILGIAGLLDNPINSQEELNRIVGYIKQSTHLLDNFTKELNQFIADEQVKINSQ
jgi:signal transduction histidine kinase